MNTKIDKIFKIDINLSNKIDFNEFEVKQSFDAIRYYLLSIEEDNQKFKFSRITSISTLIELLDKFKIKTIDVTYQEETIFQIKKSLAEYEKIYFNDYFSILKNYISTSNKDNNYILNVNKDDFLYDKLNVEELNYLSKKK